MIDSSTSAVIVTIIIVGVFLVGRELICWYWKVNRQVELLENIYAELKKQNNSAIVSQPQDPLKVI